MIELVRGLHNLGPAHHGCVLSIGNFDGVHLGHQALVTRVASHARDCDVPATLLTFEPTPLECFQPDLAPPRIYNLREKLTELERHGAERLIIVRFDWAFASMTAESFIQDLLLARLGIRHIVIGDDFRFGKNRAGDFTMLKRASETAGFGVEAAPTVELEGERVSSTRLRAALSDGDLDLASRLAGRPFRIAGRVCGGLGLGRELGAPTVNIDVRPARALRHGVYAVTLQIEDSAYQAVANFGLRPTVETARNPDHPLLEAHVLDGAPQGQLSNASVTFHAFLRDEQRFPDLDALKAQIGKDISAARDWFAVNHAS